VITHGKSRAALPAASASDWLRADGGFESRWLICGLLFLATSINYLDRQVFSILIPDLQDNLHISELAYGRLVMAFQLSYALVMIGAGKVLDRIGARVGLAISVFIWSLAEIGHSLARSAVGFGIARFSLGFGEAANFPACIKLIANLFPAQERATATGIVNSATAVGDIAAPALVPTLAASYGWQSAFIATGLFGFVWLIAWGGFHRRLARRPSTISPELEVEPSATTRTEISWRALLGYRQLWAFAFARILVDPIWYFYLFWLPKYLAQAHNIRGTAATPYLSLIYACSGVGCVAGGYCSSALIKRGWTVNAARKTVMWALVAIMSPILLVADRSGSVGMTMLLIGIAVGAHQALSTHLFTLASDLFPSRITGTIVGLGSSLSALASIGAAELIVRVLQNNPNAYSIFFVVAACLYPVAMLVIQALSPRLIPARISS